MKATKEFVGDYMDQRAQTKLAMKNPNGPLPTGPTPTFASRFADPSHPASSGSLVSLVTSGHIDLPLPIIGSGSAPARSRGSKSVVQSALAERQSQSTQGGIPSLINEIYEFAKEFGFEIVAPASPGTRRSSSPSLSSLAALPNIGPDNLKKFIKKNVLYLMIVNMPTEAEMQNAQRVVAESTSPMTVGMTTKTDTEVYELGTSSEVHELGG
ncbi:hypothetical protein VTN96DRAFT_1365 [Rasamsonia emersonii]